MNGDSSEGSVGAEKKESRLILNARAILKWLGLAVRIKARVRHPAPKAALPIRRGRERPAVFIATLGWSRATHVEFVTEQRMETQHGSFQVRAD